MNDMQHIIQERQRDLTVLQNTLAELHELYANNPMANEYCRYWIRQIGGQVETLKANIAAAEYFEKQEGE